MSDEESLKMATLKKAYAEIILNTSKEAAARIMVADRRALSFEKELFALKQDALRMLVQLKQTLDSKNAAAEVISAKQQRKIEELEAQLSEAEGIIVDLRQDLRLAQKRQTESKALTYERSDTVGSAQEQPSTPFQLTTLSHCDRSLETYHKQCSSCSSESDEKYTKNTCYGSEEARNGFRRNRKNVKYREAIAALRSCSRGRRSRSCQPPDKIHKDDIAHERSSEILVKESDFSFDIDPLKLKPSVVDSSLHVEIPEVKSTRAESDKALKFTFQRKRKKKVLGKLDNNITSEGHPAKMQKIIVNDELTKDSQQLLQVAHQLIALSGNDPS